MVGAQGSCIDAKPRKSPLRQTLMPTTAALTSLITILSGCSQLLGMCDSYYGGATWQEAGTFEALESIGVETAPRPGLPFAHPPVAGANLTLVQWKPEFSGRPPDGVREITLDAEGTVTVMADNRTSVAQVRAAFQPYLKNVTSATAQEIAGWSEQGAANARERSEIAYGRTKLTDVVYAVSIPGPFRVDALYNEAKATPETGGQWPGRAWHKAGPWAFQFEFPMRSATLPGDVNLEADPTGLAWINLPGEPSTPTQALIEARDALAAANLTLRGPEAGDFEIVQC